VQAIPQAGQIRVERRLRRSVHLRARADAIAGNGTNDRGMTPDRCALNRLRQLLAGDATDVTFVSLVASAIAELCSAAF